MPTWVAFSVACAEDTVPAYMEFAFRVYNAVLLSANRVPLSSVNLPKLYKKQSLVLNNRPHLLATLELTIVTHAEFQGASWSSGTRNSNLKLSVVIKATDFSKFSR